MSEQPRYREELLHWVWKTAQMELDCLETTSGKKISIFDTGTANKADGPDFLNASFQIGNLSWFGDVEMHWQPKEWTEHGHHIDTNYNRVVLHVVWNNDTAEDVTRQDGTSVQTLALGEYLSQPLQSFLGKYTQEDSLPCSGQFSFISQKAFQKQLEKADREYFEQKVHDLISFWDASLPPSKAWQKMLATSLFDGLGIAHNREPMRNLLEELYPELERIRDKSELISFALSTADLHSEKNPQKYRWTHKGSRPANHPKVRIPQAASCLWFIHRQPFKAWLKSDTKKLWEEINAQITTHPGLGKQRKNILFGTVWLPCLFILGNIFASESIRTSAFELWQNHRAAIPQSLLKPFKTLGIPSSCYRHSLGAVYQLRSYCRPRHCEHCEVFKSVISS